MIYGTIEEEVEAGKELTRAHRLFNRTAIIHYTKSGESIKIPMNALVSDFRDLLDECIIRLDLTEEGQAMYRYAPKRLSLDLYGTTQYWSILLHLNGAHSVIDFTPKKVRCIDPSQIDKVINEILIIGGYMDE